MQKVSHIPTFDTTKAPDELIARDAVVIQNATGSFVLRHHDEERVVRIKGAPVRFESRSDALAYAARYAA